MSGEDSGEKVHDPTPERLAEARRKGDIPRSADANAAAAYLGLLAAVAAMGAWSVTGAASTLMVFLDQPDRLAGLILGPGGAGLSAAIIGEAARALAPFFLAPLAAVLVSLFAQRAIVFSTSKLEPKLSKLSPLSNFKQKFGPSGLVEFGKSAVKLVAIACVLVAMLRDDIDGIVGAATADARVLGALLAQELVEVLTAASLIAVAIAGVDLVWQRFDHARKLRMSLEEIKEEVKRSEGDPHVKAQRRARAESIATNRMMLDVPKADVVIVNPTHYAVALRWSRAKGSAPECVAKGEGEVALRIREVAAIARVPIHSDPPTARALHATVEIGREIAPEHYRAVAAAIRFADRMRKAARARGEA
ncbi:flagellar biosynthesis protein FlhB [Amaricoccus sp.]|uniref:EscU/YscU/HrcU family type III secretion system export apparatus switch protein n=1 Tax=Amaricoccus sp. TaxID=1872485 RepID=UPI001B55D479|nr:flagellar type III secretion system protein FlhB [Amaricoccus sp.]MBP7002040.1 flagellar biosynthesis protein FlhB [Amaricoccus sp.]